jgi:hypothetical protein
MDRKQAETSYLESTDCVVYEGILNKYIYLR